MVERAAPPIRAIRRAKGLTQKALAARAGIAPNTVSMWERGGRCPPRWILEAVAAALGEPVASLDPGCWERRTRARYGDDPAALELRRLRRAAGLTVEQVAATIGTGTSAVRFWETGRGSPDRRYHRVLARLYGVGAIPLPKRVAARAEGAGLAAVRARAGLSRWEAARRLGVAASTLFAWERRDRRPPAAAIEALARLYGVDEATVGAGVAREGTGPPIVDRGRLRGARLARGWTQAELSARSGIPVNTIARWETEARAPRRESWQKLTAALGVPIEALAQRPDADVGPEA
jgi:transcriptional regulator with XRE-family HTH domain